MKSAGISDSESNSNANIPLPQRSSTTRSSHSKKITSGTASRIESGARPAGRLQEAPSNVETDAPSGIPESYEVALTPDSSVGSSRQSTPPYDRPPSSHHRPTHPDLLTLNVGTLTGRFSIHVRATDAVWEVKRHIQEMEGIPAEAQILIWRDKALVDDSLPISHFGIQSDSTLQLVLHMSAGPGPPMKLKKADKEDESVVLLLCKEDEDMYMLEFHMTDPKNKPPDRRRLIELAELAGVEVFQDLSPNSTPLFIRSLTGESRMSTGGRPISSDSTASTSTFMSLTGSRSEGPSSSRPATAATDSSFRPSSGESAIQDLLRDVLGHGEAKGTSRNRAYGYPRTAKKRIRPATAISVMRLPGGSRPMIIIPKTRPSSAKELAKKPRCVLDDTPPATPPDRRHPSESVARKVSKPTVSRSRLITGSSRRNTIPTAELNALEDHLGVQATSSEHLIEFTTGTVAGRMARTARVQTSRRGSKSSPRKSRDSLAMPIDQRPRSKRDAKPGTPRSAVTTIITPRRCYQCKKKVGPATLFKCKCNQIFCSVHRYSDRHSCTFDYRTAGKAALAKDNPLIKKDKLSKI